MKHRLRHPITSLREPFGKAGLTVAVIALVFAMLGGAYAATSNGGGKATASAKGKPGPRGKTGKTGPAGPVGPQGPAGANGKDGSNGTNGKDGTNGESVTLAAAGSCGAPGGTKVTVGGVSKEICNGAPGAAGKSVIVKKVIAPGEEECNELGGVEYEVQGAGSPTEVCNGEKGANGAPGAQGPQGEPWTAGGTLPVGATETGTWSVTGTTADTSGVYAAISFPIKLAGKPSEYEVRYVPFGEEDEQCLSINSEIPTAPSKTLCVYESESLHATSPEIYNIGITLTPSLSRVGALIKFTMTGVGFATGTFAVTG